MMGQLIRADRINVHDSTFQNLSKIEGTSRPSLKEVRTISVCVQEENKN